MESENPIVRFFESSDWFGTLLLAALIVVCTALVTRFVAKLMRKLLKRDDNPLPSASIFINIARAGLWVAGMALLLEVCFNIDANALLAGLGVAGIAISLGLQDTISNLIGGLQVSLMHLAEPGQQIKVGDVSGTVEDVTWRHTIVKTQLGWLVAIPNSVMGSSMVIRLPEVQSVYIALKIPVQGYTPMLEEQIVNAASSALGDLEAQGHKPALDPSGSSNEGGAMGATLTVHSDWSHTDSYLTSKVLKEVLPLLQVVS